MDTRVIHKFAVEARRKLTQAVIQKAYQFGITEEKQEAQTLPDGLLVNGVAYQKFYERQYKRLLVRLERESFRHVIEEVTYTWFNRFVALRFLEVNDYLPIRQRILSSEKEGKLEPDAVSNAHELIDELDLETAVVYRLQDENKYDELFKYMVTKQCNLLGEIIPNVFSPITDEIELLFPDNVWQAGGVVHDLIRDIPADDWQDVEIIGWLYQFYISEEKEAIYTKLKQNKKVEKQEIPAVTQLFTPDWIVKFMVDNSLGRFWKENQRYADINLPYYLEAAQNDSLMKKLKAMKDTKLNPEDITVLDPCVGSGHILVYAFDVLFDMYLQEGYAERDIPYIILENNLYGIDIDKRATQLATFALIMKAREKNRRLFRNNIRTNIISIEESNLLTDDNLNIFTAGTNLKESVEQLIHLFKDAKMYGSILHENEMPIHEIKKQIDHWEEKFPKDIFEAQFKDDILPLLAQLVRQAELLANKYDIVVTNPPYMGGRNMNRELSSFVKKHYPNSKSDLFAVMMERMEFFVKPTGFIAHVTMQSWMFLSSYEKFRKHLMKQYSIVTMTHMANNVMGIAFGTAATVFRKKISDYIGVFHYVAYEDLNEHNIPFEFPMKNHRYAEVNSDGFTDIPGAPIAYWASEQVRRVFRENPKLGEVAEPKVGLQTGNNNRFLRLWHEVNLHRIGFGMKNRYEAEASGCKWFPYNKGGSYRKWYGNQDYLVNWKKDGYEIRNFTDGKGKQRSVVRNPNYYFREGITWSDVTSGVISMRYRPMGSIHDVTGMTMFMSKYSVEDLLGILNSKVIMELIQLVNPSMHFQIGDVQQLPIIYQADVIDHTEHIVHQNISFSKTDWDSFETSWDFKQHPFLTYRNGEQTIEAAYRNWAHHAERQFNQLKANEEELNRIFIDLYGLQDELTPEVEDTEVTVRRADLGRDIRSFLSYCVGLVFGRYSLDQPGLAYAGGEWDSNQYQSFRPTAGNVIPVTDEAYFDEDMVTKISDIVAAIFGPDHLEQNLDYIADSLTRRGTETARERLRRYFLKEFYKDHLQMYQKRPIYWMFTSGGQNGFQALMYLHRYDRDLVARVRTDYVHVLERKLEDELTRLEATLSGDAASREKAQAKKQKEKLTRQLHELQAYDEIIAYQADRRLEIDLDDGVKANYAKFQNIEVPQEESKVKKANVLAKI